MLKYQLPLERFDCEDDHSLKEPEIVVELTPAELGQRELAIHDGALADDELDDDVGDLMRPAAEAWVPSVFPPDDEEESDPDPPPAA